jgi:glycosyltransferase involved in cell wall biosynthesis
MTAVSIIIPARDAEQTLAATLDSVVAQDFSDWEAIIVNDGSRDGTAAIASHYAGTDSRIRSIGTQGVGLASARNEGLHQADGEALLFLDSDDWIGRTHVARLHAALREDSAAAASYCGYARVTPAGQIFMPRFAPEVAIDPLQVFVRRNALASHGVLIGRCQMEDLGGFDAQLLTCEDWDLWQRLAFAGARFAPVSGLYAFYRLRPGSLSTNVAQLLRDGETIIGNGFRRLASDFSSNRDLAEEEASSLAHFALWCQAVAAGQRRPLPTSQRPLPLIRAEDGEVKIIAMTLLEALCTGGACTPATFARNWQDTDALLQPLLESMLAKNAQSNVRNAFARLLGVDLTVPADLVSVVIPAYRAADTVDETLCSVSSQTHSVLDIIAVDDGSPDTTPDIILSHAARDPRICMMQQVNSGVAVARNTGWKASAADYIAFVDADDLWAPAKIEKQLDALRAQSEVGLAYTWYAKIDADSLITSRSHRPKAEGHVLKAIFGGNFVGNGSAALMTRAALETANGFDASLRARGAQGCEDFSIYFRIAEKYRFALVPEQLTGYRELPGNMSSDMLRMLRSFDLVGQEMLARHPSCRRDIARGRAYFMEWSLIAAAERGDFSSMAKLATELTRHSPWRMAVNLSWRLPRALVRGVRLRISGAPRRRGDYCPSKFTIGQNDELHSQ